MRTIMKIYTRTGDLGKTKLLTGSEVYKSDARLNAYGDLDELNSCLGMVLSELEKVKPISPDQFTQCSGILVRIQNELFVLGSLLACEKPEIWKQLPQLSEESIPTIEKAIDVMTDQMTPLKNFILPGGSELSARLHMARTICRRTERVCVLLAEKDEIPDLSIQYLNRLSDFLFTAARFANHLLKVPDCIWDPKTNPVAMTDTKS